MAGTASIREFLEKVAKDPGYRDRLTKDPVKTLNDAGFNVSAGDIPPGGIKLPPAQEILDNLDRLAEDVEGVHWHRFKS